MGTKSKGKSGSRNGAVAKVKTTPSGITYDEFMKMSVEQREQVIMDILSDENITVPDYLDQTATQKVIYALGMDGKPSAISDSDFDKLDGKPIYRTVNDNKYLNSNDILDQIAFGDYTRFSDSGGSVKGRGIYFADDLGESLSYGYQGESSVIRMKLKPDFNLGNYSEIYSEYKSLLPKLNTLTASVSKTNILPKSIPAKSDWVDDGKSLWALSRGYDGWFDKNLGYYVVVNRSKTYVSTKYKRYTSMNDFNNSWHGLKDSN